MSSSPIDAAAVEAIARRVLERLAGQSPQTVPAGISSRMVRVGVSVRHIHLTQEDVEKLFGPGYQIKPRNELYQTGEFASTDAVTLVGPRMRCMDQVRILGPTRKFTQVELSRTDCIYLGVDAPVRPSGNHEGTPGIILVGPYGVIHLRKGVIRANRHLHLGDQEAKALGFKDNDIATVRVRGEKSTVFDDVQIRVHPMFKAELHLDTDDANAAGVSTGDMAEVL